MTQPTQSGVSYGYRIKVDLYKLHKADYAATRVPRLITIRPAAYLTVAGQGEPGGEPFQRLVGALYGIAFTVKMKHKFAGRDYAVCKLEGLWPNFGKAPKNAAHWKLLIRVPGFLRPEHLHEAADVLIQRGKGDAVRDVALETINEGLCVQMLHVGPYAQEHETISQMEAFAREQGLTFHGAHHEVYLSDPRRVPEARLRTILRHPVKPA